MLKSNVGYYCETQPTPFNVPTQDLKFGSFDDLIRLTDDMAKFDSQVESVARRIERMYLDVEPTKGSDSMNEMKIISNTQTVSFRQYLQGWQWDEAKYPKSRGLQNTLTLLLSVANKIDEEGRQKGSQFGEVKTAVQNMEKKEKANLSGRDMIDILTPDKVSERDFTYTEHLTTVIMILPQTSVEPFLKSYESYAEKVVPLSAKKFTSIKEEDGTEMWRVVMFKCCVDTFTKRVREERIGTCRMFEYSSSAYAKIQEQRKSLKTDCDQQEKIMKGFCKAALSDVMVAWTHIKAMRVFVESTLRFGHSDKAVTFSAFLFAPKDNLVAKARKALGDSFGGSQTAGKEGDDEEDYFPYVCINFTPFAPLNKM
jgi:V-type H+-transporting ATPase subunit C